MIIKLLFDMKKDLTKGLPVVYSIKKILISHLTYQTFQLYTLDINSVAQSLQSQAWINKGWLCQVRCAV